MFSKADIEKYFNAEKSGSRVFITIGIIGILLAIVFFLKTDLHKGMAVPLTSVSFVLIVIGYTVYSRSDRQKMENLNAFEINPALLKDKELPRMKKVMKNFVLVRWVEIFLFLAGAVIYIYFIRDFHHDFWRGFGFALAIMALLTLAVDYFAEKRGNIYTKGLESFLQQSGS